MNKEASPFIDREPIATPRAIELLSGGTIELVGRMGNSSNATFLVNIEDGELIAQAIYKPKKGERPLHDFPSGLYRREIAAFRVSEELGWHIVPPTIERLDAPFGEGGLQLFIPHELGEHYFTLLQADEKYHQMFMRICAFDIVINNTDRKSGHCLLGTDGRIWAIDHGLAFHHQFKLRTVVWDFGGEPIGETLLTELRGFLERPVSAELADLLSPFEVDAMLTRTKALVELGAFPKGNDSHVLWPWPLV